MHSGFYLGPYMFWIFIAVIVISGMFFGYLKSRSRDNAIRDLAARGQPIPSEMFQQIPKGSCRGLLIGGLVMLFIGIALSVFMWSAAASIGYEHGNPVFVGLFPGGIGLALILSYFFLGRGRNGDGY